MQKDRYIVILTIYYYTRTQGIDDEDDEPTLSTDYCGGSSIEKDPPSCVTETSTSPSSLSQKIAATEQIASKSKTQISKEITPISLALVVLAEPLSFQDTMPVSTSVKAIISPVTVEPIAPQKCSKIQKQISLYEREYSDDYKQLKQDVAKFTRRPCSSGNVAKRWTEITAQNSSHISADSLHQSFAIGKINSDDHRMSAGDEKLLVTSAVKTMSCINLKTCVPPCTPGAVLVKEKFIEPPLRIAKSFHGNTSFLSKCSNNRNRGVISSSSDIVGNDLTAAASCSSTDSVFKTNKTNNNVSTSKSPQKTLSSTMFKNRFIATKVDEACKKNQQDDDNDKNDNANK